MTVDLDPWPWLSVPGELCSWPTYIQNWSFRGPSNNFIIQAILKILTTMMMMMKFKCLSVQKTKRIQTDGQIDRQTDRRTDGRTDGRTLPIAIPSQLTRSANIQPSFCEIWMLHRNLFTHKGSSAFYVGDIPNRLGEMGPSRGRRRYFFSLSPERDGLGCMQRTSEWNNNIAAERSGNYAAGSGANPSMLSP